MKKLILLSLISCSIGGAFAQKAKPFIVNVNGVEQQNSTVSRFLTGNDVPTSVLPSRSNSMSGARTTTTGGSRWYNYVDYQVAAGNMGPMNYTTTSYLWYRCNSLDAYTAPSGSGIVYDTNKATTMGYILDPFAAGFGDVGAYSGQINIGSTNSYVVDSILVVGYYGRNQAKPSVVDMMHFAVFYGDGTSTSNIFGQHYFTGMLSRYGSDTVHFVDCFHDSLTNRAKANTGGGAILTADYSLNSTNQWDTLNGGLLPIQIQLPSGGLTVPAGHNFVGMTMSYESGDAGFTPLDTVLITDASGMNGHYKYNMFRPLLAVYGTSTSPLFPPYNDWHTNGNTGLFKYQPDGGWFGYYVPMWAWSTNNGTAASDYQFPYVSFHIVCTSCGLVDVPGVSQIISSVKAYPNPATDEVAISFNLSNASDVTVTLTNAIGQLVSAQHMGNMSNGKAIFNTSNVAAGIYFYTVEANGQREVGRITVAH